MKSAVPAGRECRAGAADGATAATAGRSAVSRCS